MPATTSRRTRRPPPASPVAPPARVKLPKAASGIAGLDEITGGGLPRGRPTLICGGPGCGKTLFAMEFLIRGALDHDEPGVFVSFEETAEELAANVASLGFNIDQLQAQNKLAIDFVRVERSEIQETGEYDLEGLFVRIKYAIDSVKAKRVVLDTIESLFSGLPNPAVLRSEIRRLFRWLKEQGQTVVITGEKGEGSLTRQGLEEYVSDCVIFLDHRVNEQSSTRRLRIVKYRGTLHGTNEYPFLIDEDGISILPVTSMGLAHTVSNERISSGIPRLDQMLSGKGYYRGTTVLVSGTAGTGKTTIAASLAHSACGRGERCIYFAYEESSPQLVRNMRSVGIDLQPHIDNGLLTVLASRPTTFGLERQLVAMHKAVRDFKPAVVIVDPITNLVSVGTEQEILSMMTRLIDFLKAQGITTFYTSLTTGGESLEQTDVGISSLVDTWLMLAIVTANGERNRTLTMIKSRGMHHSNQAAEYVLSSEGVQLRDTYLGPFGVLTGSARLAQETADAAAAAVHDAEVARQQQDGARRRRELEFQIAGLREELEAQDLHTRVTGETESTRRDAATVDRQAMGRSRSAFKQPGHEKRSRP